MMLVIPKEKHQFTLGRRKVLFGKQFPLTLNYLSTTWFALLAVKKKKNQNILRLSKRRQEKLSVFESEKV